jgi:hypothetical protein
VSTPETPGPAESAPALPPPLAAALVAALAEIRNVAADARADVRTDKGNYSYAYATLGQVLDLARPVLSKHGLGLVQVPLVTDPRTAGVRTLLVHSSGETLEAELLLPVARGDAQGIGSAISYARRYSAAALLGIATDEDDDGQAASAPPPRRPPAEPARADRGRGTGKPAPAKGRGEEPKKITEAQRKRLWAITMEAATGAGFDRHDAEERLRAVLGAFGVESSKDLRASDYEAACDAVGRAFVDGPGAAALDEPGPFD